MSTQVSTTTSSEPPKVAEPNNREAIIFIPGIGRAWDDPMIEGVARRIATAIDRQSTTEKAKAVVETAEQEYGVGYKCKMFTIVKKDGQEERPLIDVFGLDYNDTLVESYANRPLFMKIIMLAVTMFDSFIRLIFRFHKPGKGWKEKIQLFYGFLISSLLVAYFVILLAAVIASFEQLRNIAQKNAPVAQQSQAGMLQAPSSGIRSFFGAAWGGIKNIYQRSKHVFTALIVLLTAIGFVVPPKAKLKENISVAATNYLCLIHYLNWGERSHAIGGKLESLLEFVVEREPRYERIHIVGYSFGSVVAIDNLFTVGRKPIDRFRRINTLVTIGCPFDMIRTYWPGYFEDRQSVSADAPSWLNVYSPIDVLSSNFADGGNEQPVQASWSENDVGVQVDGQLRKPDCIMFSQGSYQGLGVIDILTLTGFKAHSLYWGETVRGEITCFHDVVKRMYHDTPVLN